MKNFALIRLILLAVLCLAPTVFAQTRVRQVTKTKPEIASSPPIAREGPSSAGASNENPPLQASEGPQDEIGEDAVIRVNTALVTVPVSVMDRDGRYIADLKQQDFRIFEDGLEQRVAYFAAIEKPFTVLLMLDTSASTWSKLGQIREAAAAFVNQLRPADQVMVVSFARGVTIKCQATTDRQKILEAIESTGRGLSTHLYEAVDKIMRQHLPRLQGRKAIVLFSDGVDATSNNATYESTVRVAEELDAIFYPILFDTYDPQSDQGNSPAPRTGSGLPAILRKIPLPLPIPIGGGGSNGGPGSSRADYNRGAQYLRDLATRTGGWVYEAGRDLSLLPAAFRQIAEELGRQYSLGYYPAARGRINETRRIKVTVRRDNLTVRARDSYIH